jgi:very-short-patch-repair endonuclease
VDFYAPRARLVIELDGSQHQQPVHEQRDAARDSYLQALGLAVLRFSNAQVLEQTDAVVEAIAQAVARRLNLPENPP